MTYRYESKICPLDFWLLSMYQIYHSIIGVCNLVFGAAMIGLTYRFWREVNGTVQGLLFLACLVIPVLHPLLLYGRARMQVRAIPRDMWLSFDEKGIHVAVGWQKELIGWQKVQGVKREWNMLLIFIGGGRGYMLTDRMLGSEKEAFYHYVRSRIEASQKKTLKQGA